MAEQTARSRRTDLAAVLVVLIAVFLGPFPTSAPALGQQEEPATLEDAIETWLHIRPWVDELHVPPRERISDERDLGPVLDGVSVILRFQGRIIGVGEANDRGPDTLRQAVARAVTDARNSRRIRELPLEMLEAVGRQSIIELELRLPPEPLRGDRFEDVASAIRPGIDGLAVRRGETWNWAYPGRMQGFGLADRPDRVLVRLLRELGLPPKDPGELRRLDDVEFYRFPVMVLTQSEPNGMPFESVRGARVVPIPAEASALARSLGRDAAANLVARLASDPTSEVGDIPGADRLEQLGLFGDYDLIGDLHDPMIAPPADQALVAWALARYADVARGLSDEERTNCRRVAGLVVERLDLVDQMESDPIEDPRCVALLLLAARHLESDPAWTETDLVVRARARFLRDLETTGDARAPDALTALAACTLAVQPTSGLAAADAAALLEAVWRGERPEELIGSLHALALADRALGSNPNRTRQLEAARYLVEAAIANQLGHRESLVASTPPAADLAGGFVLSGAPRATAGASSLRPALALAALPPLPSDEADRAEAWDEALRLALRFARQLQVEESQAGRYPSVRRARGGLRSTPWSGTARLSDTALALLLAAEVLAEPTDRAPQAVPERP